VAGRVLSPPVWRWTDDTAMALSVVEVLRAHGRVDQDALAAAFARGYDPSRGYGASMHRVLRDVGAGRPWAEVTREAFGGLGSYGNGAAMRVAPLGAWFAGDADTAAAEAARSAAVTHAHPEAAAGAVAVAVAASLLAASRGSDPPPALLDEVADRTPPGDVADRLRRADRLRSAEPAHAAAVLGNGSELSARDTVPFALWSAATSPDDLAECLWRTVSALGDRDTTCAIAGGVVAARTGLAGVPAEWLARAEPLPAWARG
jgi:ADP-ribosylglycohydrolase